MLSTVPARIRVASAGTIHVPCANSRKVAIVLLCNVCMYLLLEEYLELQQAGRQGPQVHSLRMLRQHRNTVTREAGVWGA